jgi:hypothetical protein
MFMNRDTPCMGQKLFRQKLEIASDYQGEDDYSEETFHELMGVARLELPAYAEDVLQADKEKFYSELSWDIESSQWFEESFPEPTFALCLAVIQDARFLRSRVGWTFLMLFESEWDKVTEQQRDVLLQTLAMVYEKFEDWMPRFSISELVGEKFPASQAHAFFQQFAHSSNETARTFVPHGYEHALRNSTDAALTAQLWRALLDMEHDQSGQVRGEVQESLRRLAYHGLQRPT